MSNRAPAPPSDAERPWERRIEETEVSFEAFRVYRDMGAERSLAKVGERLGKSKALMDRWSAQHDWNDRALAWDHHFQGAKDEAAIESAVEMGRRHAAMLAETGGALIEIPRELIGRISERRAAGEDPFKNWSDKDLFTAARTVARILPDLIKAERLVTGQSTQNIGGHTGGAMEVDLRDMREWPRPRLEGYLAGLQDGAGGAPVIEAEVVDSPNGQGE